MGSYKWGFESPNMGNKYSYPTYSPTFLTTHEPQSSVADAGAAQLLPLLLAFGVLACLEHKSALNSRQTEGFLRGLIQDYSRGLGSRFRLLHGLRCRPWALRFRERLGHPALM